MNPGADAAFEIAREKIFSGNRQEGREILYAILKSSPEYADVRILLARSYAWDGDRKEARNELLVVLKKTPDHEDAISALYDVEVWDGKYEAALNAVDAGLKYYPNSPGLLCKKAKVLVDLENTKDALTVLNRLEEIDPGHKEGALIREQIRIKSMKYTAGASYGVDIFSRAFDPAHYASIQLSRLNTWGSSMFRMNYTSRFSSHGLQTEIDLYPKISKGVYAYVNYGYSSSHLFSRHRMGGEIYTKLPYRLEVSGGARYLYFQESSKVLIYTGSVGWYFKSYWLSYRPYITPDEARTSFSSSLTARRYFKDADSYVGIAVNFGFSPDERRIQSGTGLSADGIYTLKSQNAGLTWQNKFSEKWILNINYTVIHQELTFDVGQYAWINSCFAGVKRKF